MLPEEIVEHRFEEGLLNIDLYFDDAGDGRLNHVENGRFGYGVHALPIIYNLGKVSEAKVDNDEEQEEGQHKPRVDDHDGNHQAEELTNELQCLSHVPDETCVDLRNIAGEAVEHLAGRVLVEEDNGTVKHAFNHGLVQMKGGGQDNFETGVFLKKREEDKHA